MVLMGIVAIAIMVRFPLVEGRAKDLDLFSIYADPLILYGYVASIPFFIALSKAFRLLGYIRQDQAFSTGAVKTVRNIKHCALLLGVFMVLAGLYIMMFHHKSDDPAGFLAICIAAVFVTLAVAAGVGVFEKILQNGMDIKAGKEHIHEP
jgi:hypothetical protein